MTATVRKLTPERPRIQLSDRGSRLHEDVDATLAALQADHGLFQRDGQLVHVIRVADADAEREQMEAGTPQIRPVPQAQLAERITRVADVEKLDRRSGSFAPAAPTTPVVAALHARGEWPGIPALVAVAEAPVMRRDGTLVQTRGYDPRSGYLYLPSQTFPTVPEAPTQEEAGRALRALAEPWAEMSWISPADAHVPVAAVLTALARPGIRGPVPGICVDASVRGAGKTLTAQCAAVVATGRSAAPLTFPGDDVEREKVLGALALRGATFVLFDNVEGTFGGAALDKVLTCGDRVGLRVLGKSDAPELAWRAQVLATGNGLMLGGDTARRVLLCRQEPDDERPEELSGWKHDPLLPWVGANRASLVVAGLTVLRGYVAAGRPSMGLRSWGSFEAWSALVANAIRWAGGPDVMECRPSAGGQDDEATILGELLEGLQRLAPEGMTARGVVQTLYPRERLRGEDVAPDGFERLREAIELLVHTPPGKAPDTRKIGNQLRRAKGRWVRGRRLVHESAHGGVKAWRVEERRS